MQENIDTIKNWLGSGSIDLFGSPYAGKDTQGRLLAEYFNGELVAGGDILRSHHDQEELKRIMASGDLIPSEMYFNILLPYLSQDAFVGKPLILSAVGRKKGEETVIMNATKQSSHDMKAVIVLTLSENEVWKRFDAAKQEQDRGDRIDDNNKEILANRLDKYKNQTLPVLEYYKENGLLIEVDGSLSREQVTDEVLKALLSKATASY